MNFALLQIATEAEGKVWKEKASQANHYVPRAIPKSRTSPNLQNQNQTQSRPSAQEDNEWAQSSYQRYFLGILM